MSARSARCSTPTRRSRRTRPVRLAKSTSNLFRPRATTDAPGLDASGLAGVLAVDPTARTADVQGMCTYEHLVEATLAHGLMPLVVPQLRTITLGGAVAGLGIESTSFRHGLPHESVLEMDVLTGAGKIITATPDGEHAELFAAFPNSYGSLGYATRLRIELQPVERLRRPAERPVPGPRRARRSRRRGDVHRVVGGGAGRRDGRRHVRAGRGVPRARPMVGADDPHQRLHRSVDLLPLVAERARTMPSRPATTSGAGTPTGSGAPARSACSTRVVRRLWPKRYRRSDVYHRLVRLEHRFGVAARLDRLRGAPGRERVVQDVEIPLERTAEFLRWFVEHVRMSPVWLCPLRLREPDGRAPRAGGRSTRCSPAAGT